jgi:hypothetical protein
MVRPAGLLLPADMTPYVLNFTRVNIFEFACKTKLFGKFRCVRAISGERQTKTRTDLLSATDPAAGNASLLRCAATAIERQLALE